MTQIGCIYMVIGCPGSGKSWVCNQLADRFEYMKHDDYPNHTAYVSAISLRNNTKPLLIETPFSVSQIKESLEKKGFVIVPVFIQEHPDVVRQRYREREGKEIPAGHLSRQNTYAERATAWQAYSGTSAQVLDYLRNAAKPANFKFPWEK